jgi:hypothetical protein
MSDNERTIDGRDYVYQLEDKLNERINDVEAMIKHSHLYFEEQIAELKGRYEGVDANLTNFIHRYHKTTDVLRDYMEIVDITITENVDGESLDYYREKKEELLEKLDLGGEKEEEYFNRCSIPELNDQPIGTGAIPDSKLPERNCSNCLYNDERNENICMMCDGAYIQWKPMKKTELEKELIVEPTLDLWEKNTVTVICPYCRQSYYLAPKSIEERVRGATRKELIEEFSEDIDDYLREKLFEDKWYKWWKGKREKYQRRVK